MITIIVKILNFFCFSVALVMFSLMTQDILSGNSMYWGILHYAFWFVFGLATVATGYAISVYHLIK